MHIDYIANGLGAQSMLLVLMACRGEIKATESITANTGWEKDRLWSNGRRASAMDYWSDVVAPLCNSNRIVPSFIRTRDEEGKEFVDLIEHLRQCARDGIVPNIPLFGSDGGRLRQVCTDKWKIRAIRQYLRSLGATTARGAQGIHYGEADRRVRGRFICTEGEWSIYRTTVKRDGVDVEIQWLSHYYPLVDRKVRREHAVRQLNDAGVPYLISSECDGCPHQDLPRWERHLPSVLNDLAETEKLFKGEFFFTDKRIPLIEALDQMRRQKSENPDLFAEADFGCQNDHCGV
jgi:hypothetical protein